MPNAGTVCRFSWPLVVDASNCDIVVQVNAVVETLHIAVGTYYWYGDGTAADFKSALHNCLETHSESPAVTTALSTDGTFSLTTSKAMTIWLTGAPTTLDSYWLGMYPTFYASTAGEITAPLQAAHLWCPERAYSDDSGLYTEHQVSESVDLSGHMDRWKWASRNYRDLTIQLLLATKLFAEDAQPNEAFSIFRDYLATGAVFAWTPNVAVPSTHSSWYVRDLDWLRIWPVKQIAECARYYRLQIPMQAA